MTGSGLVTGDLPGPMPMRSTDWRHPAAVLIRLRTAIGEAATAELPNWRPDFAPDRLMAALPLNSRIRDRVGCQQRPGIGVGRCSEHLLCRADFHQRAEIHHRNAV